jgi:hypothetical protein
VATQQRKQEREKKLGQIQGDNPVKKTRKEKTLRQIQGDNVAEQTRMREKPKANPSRQSCRENKKRKKVIGQSKETTL